MEAGAIQGMVEQAAFGGPASGESAAEPSKSWLWRKGQSGNPAGRPKGAKNRATLWAEALVEKHAEEVLDLLMKRARAGDGAAVRFLASRLLPAAKHRRVEIELPATSRGPLQDAASAGRAVLDAAFAGDIAPAEAQTLFGLIARQRNAEEVARVEQQNQVVAEALGLADADEIVAENETTATESEAGLSVVAAAAPTPAPPVFADDLEVPPRVKVEGGRMWVELGRPRPAPGAGATVFPTVSADRRHAAAPASLG